MWRCGTEGCGQWAQWGGLGLGILEVFSSLNDCTIFSPDIRHPEELSLLRKPRDPSKKKKKKLDDQCDDEAFELEGPLITPGSGEPKHTLQGCAYGEQGRRGS